MEEVIPFRTDGYIEKLRRKLQKQGLQFPWQLVTTSSEALGREVSMNPDFAFSEIEDFAALRSAMERTLRAVEDKACGSRKRPRQASMVECVSGIGCSNSLSRNDVKTPCLPKHGKHSHVGHRIQCKQAGSIGSFPPGAAIELSCQVRVLKQGKRSRDGQGIQCKQAHIIGSFPSGSSSELPCKSRASASFLSVRSKAIGARYKSKLGTTQPHPPARRPISGAEAKLPIAIGARPKVPVPQRRMLEAATTSDLWSAIWDGDAVRVQDLLVSGCDPEERFCGWTPLMKAAEDNRVDIVQMLLNVGADMNAVNNKGRSALSFAAAPSDDDMQRRETSSAVLRLLLESGADATLQDWSCCTARVRALKEGRSDALRIFNEFNV